MSPKPKTDAAGPRASRWWNPDHVGARMRRSRVLKEIAGRMILPEGDSSSHSAIGMSLPLMIERLEAAGRSYALYALPERGGYHLTTRPSEMGALTTIAMRNGETTP